MKYKELTDKPEAELKRQLSELREEHRALAIKVKLLQEKNGHKLALLRHDIARILTALSAKK